MQTRVNLALKMFCITIQKKVSPTEGLEKISRHTSSKLPVIVAHQNDTIIKQTLLFVLKSRLQFFQFCTARSGTNGFFPVCDIHKYGNFFHSENGPCRRGAVLLCIQKRISQLAAPSTVINVFSVRFTGVRVSQYELFSYDLFFSHCERDTA